MSQEKTFAGIPKQFSNSTTSKVYLTSIPYDGTSTWGKGADKGFDAFLEAAENMELYDIETDSEVYQRGIYLSPAIKENQLSGTNVPVGLFKYYPEASRNKEISF
jgi:agmatinase